MALDGMGMMLKSLGINPDEIKASIESFKGLAGEVSARQKAIDEKLDRILAILLADQNTLSHESMAEHFAEAGAPILSGIVSAEEAIEMREKNGGRTND